MPFEEIYRQNYGIVYGYLFSLCHSEHLTEELTAQTFFKAFEAFSGYKGKSKISTWLCQIAKNEYYLYIRKNKRRAEFDELDETADDTDIASGLQDKETAMDLHRLLHDMEEPYREVFLLRVFAELSFKEIGEITGHSENSARVIFHRAKIRLKKQMEGEDE